MSQHSTQAHRLIWTLRAHRTLGLLLSVAVILWALTGILHPIMSAAQSQPATRQAPPQQLNLRQAIALPTVLKQHQIDQVRTINVLQLSATQTAYRVQTPSAAQGRYFDAHTGQEITQGEQQDAIRLAAWYTAQPASQVISSRLIEHFDDDYPAVNRLLPVWRVDFQHGLRAYVEPSQSRLATLSNDQRKWMAKLFRLGHTWAWGTGDWLGKQLLMILALTCIALLTGLGIWLGLRIKNTHNRRLAQRPLRLWHRRLGLILAPFVLMWVGSGLFHLWHHSSRPPQALPIINTNGLSLDVWQQMSQQPMTRLDLVATHPDGRHPLWLMQTKPVQTASGEHQHHLSHAPQAPMLMLHDAADGQPMALDTWAKQWTQDQTGLPARGITQVQWVTSFASEYGFINKRLPVLKIQTDTPDNMRLYIEPNTMTWAAQINDMDALEGASFAYLHKWNWLPVAKPVRDSLLAMTALLLLGLVGLGWFARR